MRQKEVARFLNISPATVAAHTAEARQKLGVNTSIEAVRLFSEYENELSVRTTPIENQGSSKTIIADPGARPQSSAHEQSVSFAKSIPAGPLGSTGLGISYARGSGQDQAYRGYPGDFESTQSGGIRKGDFFAGVRSSLVDGRDGWFSRRLKRLSSAQAFGLIFVMAVTFAMLAVLCLTATGLTIQAVHTLFGQSR